MSTTPIYTRKMTKAKAWTAAVVTVAMAVSSVIADDVIGAGETGTLVTLLIEAALGVAAVYRVPNKPVE